MACYSMNNILRNERDRAKLRQVEGGVYVGFLLWVSYHNWGFPFRKKKTKFLRYLTSHFSCRKMFTLYKYRFIPSNLTSFTVCTAIRAWELCVGGEIVWHKCVWTSLFVFHVNYMRLFRSIFCTLSYVDQLTESR